MFVIEARATARPKPVTCDSRAADGDSIFYAMEMAFEKKIRWKREKRE
jgi:hypothetical protein